MEKQLPGAGVLIRESWQLFVSTWNDSVKVTIWLLYIGLARFALLLLARQFPVTSYLVIPVELAFIFASVWIGIRATRAMLDLEAGKKFVPGKKEMEEATKFILPLLWVGILQGLVVLGAGLLLILPGVYFAIALSFSNFVLLEQGIHGTQALAKSRELVRGRWWPTFWRLLAGGIVFGLGIALLSLAAVLIIGTFTGMQKFAELSANRDPLTQGAIILFQAIIQAAFIPLLIGFQVKLYRALQKNR